MEEFKREEGEKKKMKSERESLQGKRKPVSVGDLIILEISSLGKQGDGVAQVGEFGFIILVNGGVLGKNYVVQVTRVLSTMAFARIISDKEFEDIKEKYPLRSQSLEFIEDGENR